MTAFRKLSAAVLLLAALAWTAAAATAPGTTPPKPPKNMSEVTLNINAWRIDCTNYGPFVNPGGGNSGGYWGGPYNYIYGAGLWVAATTPQGVRGVACGYNPNSGQYEFCPANPYNEETAGYLTDPQSRVYLSTNASDYAEWPRKDASGKKIIKSRQDSYCKYRDYPSIFNFAGSAMLNVLVEQITYAWNYADNNDIVFFFFNVKNKNDYNLTNCYLGPGIDCDIGSEAGTAANDRTTFDYTRNLAMQFQATPEAGWPRTGVVGFRFFQGPINNTGDTVRVVDDQYPHVILPGQPLGMTAFTIFTIDIDPKTDEERYLAMEGVDWQTMVLDAYDQFGAEAAGDKRFIQASGPFVLKSKNSGSPDTMVTLCVGAICAWDTAALKTASDIAQEIFDNNFELASPPVSPKITAWAGDKFVRITWDKSAETTPDPYADKIKDTTAWYAYYKGSWALLPDKHLVDSFEIKTGPSTTVKIAKGAPNPPGGTDTVYSRFNQKRMYDAYDLQGYLVLKARTEADLLEASKAVFLGGKYKGTSGAEGYWFDKKDGVQIVRNFVDNAYNLLDTIFYLPRYDTLGTDRGLVYSVIDSEVVNGLGYYYGVIAYDYQRNAFYTHKCPISLNTNPTENAVYVVPRSQVADLKPAEVNYMVTGGSDKKGGGSVDYEYLLKVAAPKLVTNDRYLLRWRHKKTSSGGNFLPYYQAELYDDLRQTYREGFDSVDIRGEGEPAGWYFANINATDTINYGQARPALLLNATGDTVVSPGFYQPESMSFWIKGVGTNNNDLLKVEGYNGYSWLILDTLRSLPTVGTTKSYALAEPICRVRFVYSRSAGDVALDDITIRAQFLLDTAAVSTEYDLYKYFKGTFNDQMLMGGVIFKPYMEWKGDSSVCRLDSVVILESSGGSRTYPRDSVSMGFQSAIFTLSSNMWQWRGSDFEIRWKDTVNASSQPALTAQVWDLTNNVEVPLETGVTKANMVRSSWCFGPAASQSVALIDSNNVNSTGMHLCGLTLYFNKSANATSARRMTGSVWTQRPETGDIWRVYTSGPRPPTDGNLVTFDMRSPIQTASLSSSLLDKVKVVPNPFLVRADWDPSKNYPNIYFTNLPAKCTIRIYTLGGDLVRVINHESTYAEADGTERWDLLTTYNRRIASGIYIYQVDAPGIGTKIGKFAIIK